MFAVVKEGASGVSQEESRGAVYNNLNCRRHLNKVRAEDGDAVEPPRFQCDEYFFLT